MKLKTRSRDGGLEKVGGKGKAKKKGFRRERKRFIR